MGITLFIRGCKPARSMVCCRRSSRSLVFDGELLYPEQIVAIVDDDESIRHATDSLVRSFRKRTIVFASAEDFLQSGKLAETSCLISDIMMPGMSGIEMHERMLALGYAPPTVFITAFPDAGLKARAMANGALAVLEKPIDADAIAYWLNVALG